MSKGHYARIADVYDQFVQTDFDVAFFVDILRDVDGAVLELMAGTGRLTLPLLQAGIPVVAVDYSREMLDELDKKLQREGLTAEHHQMDICQLNLGQQYDKIIVPFHAFPEITDSDDQRQALQAIFKHLTPGGEFICTLHNPIIRLRSVTNQLQLAAQKPLQHGGELFVWLLQRHVPATQLVEVLEFFEEYDADGVMTHKRHSVLRFHLLDYETFQQLVHTVGFEVVQIYGDYDHKPFDESSSPFMIWVLRRGKRPIFSTST